MKYSFQGWWPQPRSYPLIHPWAGLDIFERGHKFRIVQWQKVLQRMHFNMRDGDKVCSFDWISHCFFQTNNRFMIEILSKDPRGQMSRSDSSLDSNYSNGPLSQHDFVYRKYKIDQHFWLSKQRNLDCLPKEPFLEAPKYLFFSSPIKNTRQKISKNLVKMINKSVLVD